MFSNIKMESTGFLNSKRRAIMKTAQGKFVARSDGGALVYNPKAKFHKSPGGTERATKYVKNLLTIPSPIRPKFNRVERKNKGKARGTYAPRLGGVRVLPIKRAPHISELFEGYKPKRPVGRPRKMRMSPEWNLPNPHLRKVRKNKGMARGPRKPKTMLYKIKLGGEYV